MAERRFTHSNNPGFSAAPGVLLLPFGRESYLPAIVERWRGRRLAMDETTDRIVYRLEGAPAPVTLLYTGMGSPATANGLEMVAANGARRVVVFGACGGVVPAVGIGSLVLVTEAVRGEGTTRYYAPPERPARFPEGSIAALERALGDEPGVAVHRGKVYTTDAGYRQGPEVYDRDDLLAVECEAAAVAIVGAELGLETAALLFVTDNVTLAAETDRVYRGLSDSRVVKAFETGLDAAVAALAAPAAG